MTSVAVIGEHRRAGREFRAGGVGSFVREQGDGEAVVCLHGVPASCFLYRKLLRELATRGMRGVAWDLPGLGLAERPPDFDYSWTGLGRFCRAAIDESLGRFHLVVHDIGGPVGFELAAVVPERIASLTVLNTLVEVDAFKRPWSMEPFARRRVGELYLRTLTKPAFPAADAPAGCPGHEVDRPRRARRVRRSASHARWRLGVPAHHARIRAHGRQARPLPIGPPWGPVSGPDRLGRSRSGR